MGLIEITIEIIEQIIEYSKVNLKNTIYNIITFCFSIYEVCQCSSEATRIIQYSRYWENI